MKPGPSVILGAALLCLPPAFAAPGPSNGQTPMRDVATHDQLSRSLAQQTDPIRNLGPAIGKSDEDPSLKNSSRDLIKESTIICFNGSLTLVPKRAVLFVPDRLQERVEVKPKQEVKTWADFYQRNRGWIRTVEVSREQAMGQKPISESILDAVAKSSSLVVATFKNGPISVIPYEEPEEPNESTTTKPTASTP
ncbi:MAG: hypothetical protein WD342_14605 [Verrucomicrobiales bacterium]